MKFSQDLSPVGALGDLWRYFATRRPHQYGFMGVALALSYVMISGVMSAGHVPPKPYHREIIYVQQWRADRTDAEIIAQQKIDGVEQTRQENELKRLEAERRASLKRLDDKLKSIGI